MYKYINVIFLIYIPCTIKLGSSLCPYSDINQLWPNEPMFMAKFYPIVGTGLQFGDRRVEGFPHLGKVRTQGAPGMVRLLLLVSNGKTLYIRIGFTGPVK